MFGRAGAGYFLGAGCPARGLGWSLLRAGPGRGFTRRPARPGGQVLFLMVTFPVVLLPGVVTVPPLLPVMVSDPLTVLFW